MNIRGLLIIVLVAATILLCVNIGNRFSVSTTSAFALGKPTYKVVVIDEIEHDLRYGHQETVNASQKYTALLNKMADEGWELDHTLYGKLAVFKK